MDSQQLREYGQMHPEMHGGSMDFLEECIDGDVNLNWSEGMFVQAFTPSQPARRSYLYPQCIAANKFHAEHYTRRKDMKSYLLTQTFFGGGMLEYGGSTYEVRPGDCFFIDCRREHYYRATSPDGWGYRILHFDGFAMADYYAQFAQCGGVKFSPGKNDRLQLILDSFFSEKSPPQANAELVYSLMLTQLVTETILYTSYNGKKPLPEMIEGAFRYIEQNYAAPITLDELARRCYVSKYHLCREFKRYANTSPNEYLIETRLNAAKALLQSTDLSMGEISARVGIASADHFLYLFKSREGVAPSVFRRQWRSI